METRFANFLIFLRNLGQAEAADKLVARTADEWIKCEACFSLAAFELRFVKGGDELDFLIYLFDWNKTPEGFDYWDKVADVVESDIEARNKAN